MSATERVRLALKELGIAAEVEEYAVSTGTAEEAARAAGCETGQIVKTLVFLAEGRPTIVLMGGDRQADTRKLARLVGVGRKRLRMASAEEVRSVTGYEVGGVAPVGIAGEFDVVIDEGLQRFDEVWAAAGTANAIFRVAIPALVAATGGQWAAIARDPGADE